jgi:hypothetical protein
VTRTAVDRFHVNSYFAGESHAPRKARRQRPLPRNRRHKRSGCVFLIDVGGADRAGLPYNATHCEGRWPGIKRGLNLARCL